MSTELEEVQVRAILSGSKFEESQKEELSTLTDARMDTFGNLFFVRKGAPIDLDRITSTDRVDIDDILDSGRERKRKRYLELKNHPSYRGPLILAEGDSWLEYPYAKDLLDYAGKEYAVLSLARAGDTWSKIIDQDSNPEKHYSDGTPMGLFHTLDVPDARPFDYVLLSVGGNDLIGQLRFCVHTYDKDRSEDDYIIHSEIGGFDNVLKLVLSNYRSSIHKIVAANKSVILHTYDYPNPKSGGQYIGHPLEHYSHFPKDAVGLMRRVVNQMIDLFHDGLAEVAQEFRGGKVHLIDLRKTIGTDDYMNGPDDRLWKDEMHGNNEGFKRLWTRMDKELKKIF